MKKVNQIAILEGLDDLLEECFNYSEIKTKIEITGQGNSISNIRNSRLFSTPHAIYGYKYKSNKVVTWNFRSNAPGDVFVTDNCGILKNSISGKNAEDRMHKAINDKKSIIAFFGGSTMMSMGAVTPNFSIPSLVEKILAQKYNKKAVCINFGLGGTCCREAFQVYLNEIKLKGRQANIVFYDGWNCSSYLTHKKSMQMKLNDITSNYVTDSDAMLSIRHNIKLNKVYDFGWHLKSVFSLIFAYLTNGIQKFLPNFLGLILLRIQSRLFPLDQSHKETSQLLNLTLTGENSFNSISEKAVDEYVAIHQAIKNLAIPRTGYMWIQQPLVFWGNKTLTSNERMWRENGYSSGDPQIFRSFDNHLKSKISNTPDLFSNYVDMTNVFDEVSEEVFIDSGHLNRLGNLIVSARIANEIYTKQMEFGL